MLYLLMNKDNLLTLLFLFFALPLTAQYTRNDSLMGSITPERTWWDLKYYDLDVEVDINQKFIKGSNLVLFEAVAEGQTMQIDLQPPMKITAVSQDGTTLNFEKVAKNT